MHGIKAYGEVVAVCPSTAFIFETTRRISIKFYIVGLHETLLAEFKFSPLAHLKHIDKIRDFSPRG